MTERIFDVVVPLGHLTVGLIVPYKTGIYDTQPTYEKFNMCLGSATHTFPLSAFIDLFWLYIYKSRIVDCAQYTSVSHRDILEPDISYDYRDNDCGCPLVHLYIWREHGFFSCTKC